MQRGGLFTWCHKGPLDGRVWQTHINLVPCLCQFRIYTFRCTFQPMVQQPARSNSVKWKLCTREPQLIARCLHLINVVNEASGSDWISSKQFKCRQLTEVPHHHYVHWVSTEWKSHNNARHRRHHDWKHCSPGSRHAACQSRFHDVTTKL